MGWLDTIVNVQWGGPVAALLFQSTWSDILSSNPPTIIVTVPQLSLTFSLLTNSDETYQPSIYVPMRTIMRPLSPYQNTTQQTGGPYITTTTTYSFVVTATGPPISYGAGNITVVSDNKGNANWIADLGPVGGVGDINAAQTYFLLHGWNTFMPTQTGQSSNTSHITMHQVVQNEILLFDMKQIYDALTAAPYFDITFSTGAGPGAVVGGPYPSGYVWKATLQTFKSVAFGSFKPTALNLPGPTWPPVQSQQIILPDAGTPVPSKDIDFTVSLFGIH